MKTKSLRFFVCLFVLGVFFTALGSADLELESVNVPSSVAHDQNTIPIIVSLRNTETVAQTSLQWTGSSNIGSWTGLNTLPTRVEAGATIQVTATLQIPKNKLGDIHPTLNVASTEGKSDSIALPAIPIIRSPSLSLSKIQELTRTVPGKINVANTGNIDLSRVDLTSSGDFTVTISPLSLSITAGGSPASVTVTPGILSNLKFGRNTVTITARDATETAATATTTFTIDNGFCKAGEVGGNLTINDVSIESDGDDEEIWKPLDTITVEVDLENEGDDKIQDVFVELGFFSSNGKNLANDLDFLNEDEDKIEVGDLSDGDDDVVTFQFVIPADFNEKGDFRLAIKVYSRDTGESNECTHTSSDLDNTIFQDIEIEREEDEGKLIAFDDLELNPAEAVCGDAVTLRTDVFNLGSDEQDQVKVNLVNSRLNVDLSREIREDLDEGDKQAIEFQFAVPSTATDGTYQLELSAEYDFRRGTYRESSDDPTTVALKVFGCGTPNGTTGADFVNIAASLESEEARAGEKIIVKTTLTNLANQQKDFVVTASGFENWATVESISERLVNLKAGESKDVLVTLNANPDASGEKSFVLEVRSGDQLETQEIAVNLESEQASSLSLGGNKLVWIIGAINVILIVLIIVVAVRISRR